jgi:hypothetical protein
MTELKNRLVQCERCECYATMDEMQECSDLPASFGGYICKDEESCFQSREHQNYFDAKGG